MAANDRCTCTLACIPQGLVGDQVCRLRAESEDPTAAMTPEKALRTQYGQGLADGFRITLRLFLGEPQAGAAPYTGPRTPESEAWARAALNRDPEALS